MLCLSGVVIPVFLDTITDSTQLLHQWVRVYHYGHIYMPALCVATCGLYAYTAMNKPYNSNQRQIYVAAAATTFAMVPFTWAAMAPTNNTLFQLDGAVEATKAIEELSIVQEIVVRWAWLHLFRSVFPFIGVLLGFTGTMRERSL
jgi:hypothetical protein